MIDIKFEFPDWATKIKSQEERLNLFIAAQIQTNRGMIFDKEGAHNGRAKWAPLKFRNGQILSQRGTLRKSIAPSNPNGTAGPDGIVRFSGDTIKVGTNLIYARLMNDGTVNMPGGVMRPKNAKALRIPLPQGQSANDSAKAAGKAAGMRNASKRAHELRAQIDNAQTLEAEIKYREALRKLQGKMKIGDVTSQKFIFVKSVKIPARPFDDWNDEDQKELDASLLNLVSEILNG